MDIFQYLGFLGWRLKHVFLYLGILSNFVIKYQALYIKQIVVGPDNVIFLQPEYTVF